MIKGQFIVGRCSVDFRISNIQNPANRQQAAFNLTDTNHKGLFLIRPCLGQFREICLDGSFNIGLNLSRNKFKTASKNFSMQPEYRTKFTTFA